MSGNTPPDTLHDATTLASLADRDSGDAPAFPCLTILYHPELRRVGERAMLGQLVTGQAVGLSRIEPHFGAPGADEGAPLRDPYVSRRPITLSRASHGGINIDRGAGSALIVDGRVPEGVVQCTHADLRAGVVLVLAKRVVLLLHLVPMLAPPPPLDLVGDSAAIQDVRRAILRVADLDVPVLIRGETGSGKEKIAHAIHNASARAGKPCLAINMASISPTVAASELFGHTKGSFTGAVQSRAGLFERADGGTLFLDEIGETPDNIQAMLLRVLETKELLPVGGQNPLTVDVRIVAATDRDLEQAGEEGTFRAALLFRLSGYEISVPPLRARRDDIPRLLVHFLREELERVDELHKLEAPPPGKQPWFPPSLMARFIDYDWQGNVRQLRNVVRQLVISSRGAETIQIDQTVERLLEGDGDAATGGESAAEESPSVEAAARGKRRHTRRAGEVSDESLIKVLKAHDWALGRAAASLGIPRSTLYDRIEKSSGIRTAKEVTREEIEALRAELGDDVGAMADRLEVSKRGLKLRIKELGLD